MLMKEVRLIGLRCGQSALPNVVLCFAISMENNLPTKRIWAVYGLILVLENLNFFPCVQ